MFFVFFHKFLGELFTNVIKNKNNLLLKRGETGLERLKTRGSHNAVGQGVPLSDCPRIKRFFPCCCLASWYLHCHTIVVPGGPCSWNKFISGVNSDLVVFHFVHHAQSTVLSALL